MILSMLAVALWPLNPFPHNRVSWLGNQDGLRFADPGIVFSAADLRWPPAPSAAGVPQDIGCTLEIWLETTARPRHEGIILSFYQPQAPLRIRLFRRRSLMVLSRDDDRSPHQEIDFDGAFRPQTSVLITITSGPDGSSAFVDGVRAETAPALRRPPPLSPWLSRQPLDYYRSQRMAYRSAERQDS